MMKVIYIQNRLTVEGTKKSKIQGITTIVFFPVNIYTTINTTKHHPNRRVLREEQK